MYDSADVLSTHSAPSFAGEAENGSYCRADLRRAAPCTRPPIHSAISDLLLRTVADFSITSRSIKKRTAKETGA